MAVESGQREGVGPVQPDRLVLGRLASPRLVGDRPRTGRCVGPTASTVGEPIALDWPCAQARQVRPARAPTGPARAPTGPALPVRRARRDRRRSRVSGRRGGKWTSVEPSERVGEAWRAGERSVCDRMARSDRRGARAAGQPPVDRRRVVPRAQGIAMAARSSALRLALRAAARRCAGATRPGGSATSPHVQVQVQAAGGSGPTCARLAQRTRTDLRLARRAVPGRPDCRRALERRLPPRVTPRLGGSDASRCRAT